MAIKTRKGKTAAKADSPLEGLIGIMGKEAAARVFDVMSKTKQAEILAITDRGIIDGILAYLGEDTLLMIADYYSTKEKPKVERIPENVNGSDLKILRSLGISPSSVEAKVILSAIHEKKAKDEDTITDGMIVDKRPKPEQMQDGAYALQLGVQGKNRVYDLIFLRDGDKVYSDTPELLSRVLEHASEYAKALKAWAEQVYK